jgi:hypothetical protein
VFEIIVYNSKNNISKSSCYETLLNFFEQVIHIIFLLYATIFLLFQLFYFNIANYYTLLIWFCDKSYYTHYFMVYYSYFSFSINYINYFNYFIIIPIKGILYKLF